VWNGFCFGVGLISAWITFTALILAILYRLPSLHTPMKDRELEAQIRREERERTNDDYLRRNGKSVVVRRTYSWPAGGAKAIRKLGTSDERPG
jgi:hypothetical protein